MNAKYWFLISNIDKSGTGGTHWWGTLDVHPKTKIFLFDLFGIKGLKNFIAQDDKKTIDKMLLGIEKMTRTDN